MEQAVEQLEGVIGQLGTAEPSGRNAAAALDQITDRRPTWPDVMCDSGDGAYPAKTYATIRWNFPRVRSADDVTTTKVMVKYVKAL